MSRRRGSANRRAAPPPLAASATSAPGGPATERSRAGWCCRPPRFPIRVLPVPCKTERAKWSAQVTTAFLTVMRSLAFGASFALSVSPWQRLSLIPPYPPVLNDRALRRNPRCQICPQGETRMSSSTKDYLGGCGVQSCSCEENYFMKPLDDDNPSVPKYIHSGEGDTFRFLHFEACCRSQL